MDRVTLVLCMLVFTDTFGYAVLLPLLPFSAQQFGASTLAIGAMFASYSLCQLVAAPALGSLSDRFGRRPLVLLSQIGSAIGFAMLFGASAFWVLVVSRVVDGLTAGNISILYAAVLDQFPKDAWTRRFAYLSTATGLGILLGLLTSSLVVSVGLSGAAATGLALTGLSVLLTWRFLPETRHRQPPTSALRAWRSALVASDARVLRRTAGAVLLGTLAQTSFLLALPLYLARVLGFTAEQATPAIAGLFVFAAVFQSLVLPRVVERLHERTTAMLGFACLALGSGLVGVAQGLPMVLAGAAVVMVGVATLAPTLPSLLGASNTTLDEGALMGLNQSVASVGQMIGPVLGYGALTMPSTIGYGGLNLLLALGGLVVVARLPRRVDVRR
jgi:DHA1 family tetracycline resistance protein-like MFS transporter